MTTLLKIKEAHMNQIIENCEIENKVKIDFKEKYYQWFKTLCAFANTNGGIMNIGIADDLTEVGFDLNEIDSLKRSITQICRNHSNPILKCKFNVIEIDGGKYYLQVIVDKRKETVTWLIDQSISPQLYVRHDGSTDLATIEEQVSLLLNSNMNEYDTVETGIKYDEVTFSALEEEYKANNNNEALTKKKEISYGLVSLDDYLTITGVLFADNSINKNANMVCTTWKTTNKGTNEYENDRHFTGSLIDLFHKAVEYINEVPFYYFGGKKRNLTRVDNGSFSLISLREALINALAHRDYKIDGNEIMIDCFPDRIEITSPGSMLLKSEGVKRCKLESESFVSFRRNKTICNVFEKCRLMENKGSGFEKIIDDYKDMSDEYAPLFSATQVTFTIILKNKKYKYNETVTENSVNRDDFESVIKQPMFLDRATLFGTNPRYKEISSIIENDKNVTIEDISFETGLSVDGVKYNIRKMKDACLIRKVSNGYEITNDMDRPAEYASLSKEELLKAVNWCKNNFISGANQLKDYTSYGLKHVLEEDINLYLSNGQFKAVMLLAGFKTTNVENLNWTFNILKSSPAFKKEEEEKEYFKA